MNSTYNPFVKIPSFVYLIVGVWIILRALFVPLLHLLLNAESNFLPDLLLLTLLKFTEAILTGLPFLLVFKHKGLLNPLIFPLVFGFIKTLLTDTTGLISFDLEEKLYKSTNAFKDLDETALIAANSKLAFMQIVAMASTFLGYFALGNKVMVPFQLKARHWSSLYKRIIIAGFISILLVGAFFQSQGGILKYMGSWGVLGRGNVYEDFGPIMGLFKTMVVIPALWFFIRGWRAIFNPFFILFSILFIALGFLGQGSRSSVFTAVMLFGCAYLVRYQRIPYLLAGVGAIIGFVLIGFLGNVRNSTWQTGGAVDLSLITSFDVARSVEASQNELSTVWGKENPGIAVVHAIPAKSDYLYGKTYLAAIFFWVPRAIWPDKPHGAGYYVGREIWNQNKGIPPGETAEVYYNFSMIGIIALFFFKGMVARFFVNWYSLHQHHPAAFILYALFLLFGFSLAATSIVLFLQKLLYATIILKFVRLI